MESTIRLFKAVQITDKGSKEASKKVLEETIRRGFTFSPEVVHNYSETKLLELVRMVETEVGLTPEQMNSSFHKSWQKVQDAAIEQLFLEQIIHYMTTYGFEALGIYDKDSVYIPSEQLDLPDLDVDKIRLVVIKGYTKEELKAKLLDLLRVGIALKEDTLRDVIDVATHVNLNGEEIESTKNKEVKAALYDYLNLFPKNPIEFLRHIIYRSTGKTLLIKDCATIEEIRSKDNLGVLGLLNRYEKEHGLEGLAQIFLRFKPLFLSFRVNSQLKQMINRIRRLAKKHHRPMRQDYLNEITAIIKKGSSLDLEKLDTELDRVNIFRKIRLAYALKFRTKDVSSILYRIRNGKGFAKEFQFPHKNAAEPVLHIVLDSIIKDVRKNVAGKKIYIPKYIRYTLPATEKQFTGNLPSGTSVFISNNMIFGIHWENTPNARIDLDLSVMSPSVGKIGWDSDYRTRDKDILFSGDVTDAPHGASELFYVKSQNPHELIMFVNYYNFDKDIPVPFKIMVAEEHPAHFGQNYTVNQNNVLAIAKTKIGKHQKILGLAVSKSDGCEFFFAEANIGKTITAMASPFVKHSRKYLFDFYTNTISLNDVLIRAGAKIVDDQENCDIDLSIETLEKDTIINLLNK